MTLMQLLALPFFVFAGTFALASLNHDLRRLWARLNTPREEPNDDDA
jgi:hypothetical protein